MKLINLSVSNNLDNKNLGKFYTGIKSRNGSGLAISMEERTTDVENGLFSGELRREVKTTSGQVYRLSGCWKELKASN